MAARHAGVYTFRNYPAAATSLLALVETILVFGRDTGPVQLDR